MKLFSRIADASPLLKKHLTVDFSDEEACRRFEMLTTYILLGIVGFIMSVMNICTQKYLLMGATMVLTLLCLSNFCIGSTGKTGLNVSGVLFVAEMMSIMVFFIITGTAEGFSVLWTALIPVIAYLFFNRKIGSVICFLMFLILIFFYWTPIGQSFLQITYTDSFMMRYPVFYLVLCAVIFFLETIRHKTLLEVEKARDAADEANESKSLFLARMSHEIRTPINGVLGMNELILRENTSNEVNGYAQNVQTAAHTLLSIINDILDFSKIESAKMEIIPVEYDLTRLLGDCFSIIRIKAEQKNLELKLETDKNCPRYLTGDEVRIRQILTNLLSNAVKYTNEGCVVVSVKYESAAENQINLKISVSDTGIGIPESEIPHLFDAFRRIEEAQNRHIQGTGLGLAIVRQLTDLMQGSIEVKSTVGVGTSFTITMLQAVAKEGTIGDSITEYGVISDLSQMSKSSGAYVPLFVRPDVRILVIDDVALNRLVFSSLLKATKLQIDTASSGVEALEILRSKQYDMVFTDDLMPELTGTETLERIRAEHLLPDSVPVFVVTANAVVGAKEEYLKAGFNGYLSKPIQSFELEKTIEANLPPVREGADVVSEETAPAEVKVEAKAEEKAEAAVNIVSEPAAAEESGFVIPISAIDSATAALYCGEDMSLYRVFLETFAADSRMEILEKSLSEGDIERYRTEIHALKSSAKTIGALELSAHAKELEAAAKENNTAFIHEHHAEAMREYKELMEAVKGYLG